MTIYSIDDSKSVYERHRVELTPYMKYLTVF